MVYTLGQALFDTESGKSGWGTLLGHSQREGNAFGGTDITNMTIGDLAYDFSKPSGQYGQWSKGQVGRVATPMGAGQVVGQTMRGLIDQGVLDPNERYTPQAQQRAIMALVGDNPTRSSLRGTWEGFQNLSNEQLDSIIAQSKAGNWGWENIPGGDPGIKADAAKSGALAMFAGERQTDINAINEFMFGGFDLPTDQTPLDAGAPDLLSGAGGDDAISGGLVLAPGTPGGSPVEDTLLGGGGMGPAGFRDAGSAATYGVPAEAPTLGGQGGDNLGTDPTLTFGEGLGAAAAESMMPNVADEELGFTYQEIGDQAVSAAAGSKGPLADAAADAAPNALDDPDTAEVKAQRRQRIGKLLYQMGSGLSQLGAGETVDMASAGIAYDEAMGSDTTLNENLYQSLAATSPMHAEMYAEGIRTGNNGMITAAMQGASSLANKGVLTPQQQQTMAIEAQQHAMNMEKHVNDQTSQAAYSAAVQTMNAGGNVQEAVAAMAAGGASPQAINDFVKTFETGSTKPTDKQAYAEALKAEAIANGTYGTTVTDADIQRQVNAGTATKRADKLWNDPNWRAANPDMTYDQLLDRQAKIASQIDPDAHADKKLTEAEISAQVGFATELRKDAKANAERAAANRIESNRVKALNDRMLMEGQQTGAIPTLGANLARTMGELGITDVADYVSTSLNIDAAKIKSMEDSDQMFALMAVQRYMSNQGTITDGERAQAAKAVINSDMSTMDKFRFLAKMDALDKVDEMAYTHVREGVAGMADPLSLSGENYLDHEAVHGSRNSGLAEIVRVNELQHARDFANRGFAEHQRKQAAKETSDTYPPWLADFAEDYGDAIMDRTDVLTPKLSVDEARVYKDMIPLQRFREDPNRTASQHNRVTDTARVFKDKTDGQLWIIGDDGQIYDMDGNPKE